MSHLNHLFSPIKRRSCTCRYCFIGGVRGSRHSIQNLCLAIGSARIITARNLNEQMALREMFSRRCNISRISDASSLFLTIEQGASECDRGSQIDLGTSHIVSSLRNFLLN